MNEFSKNKKKCFSNKLIDFLFDFFICGLKFLFILVPLPFGKEKKQTRKGVRRRHSISSIIMIAQLSRDIQNSISINPIYCFLLLKLRFTAENVIELWILSSIVELCRVSYLQSVVIPFWQTRFGSLAVTNRDKFHWVELHKVRFVDW